MSTKLIDFINQELDNRGWSARELARRAGLSHATINGILAETANPGSVSCKGIARAFRVPDGRIFRMAEMHSSYVIGDTKEEEEKELLDYFHYLPEEDRRTVTSLARVLYEQQAPYQIEPDEKQE